MENSNGDNFDRTTTWLKGQWSNPTDIFTILLIIRGNIVRTAVAQLCAGPIPYFTPTAFSFGWVSYAVDALYNAVGENRLIPRPELDCKLINAENGYGRTNCSWILARMLRDFDYWRPEESEKVKIDEIERSIVEISKEKATIEDQIRYATDQDEVQAAQYKFAALPQPREVRIGLRVTVWQNRSRTGRKLKGCGDLVYWMGTMVTVVQLGIASIPWFIRRMVHISGYGSGGSLPQWVDEKVNVRMLTKPKRVCLTVGNGTQEVILILNDAGQLDLETLASPQRNLSAPLVNKVLSSCLAILWIAFLINVAGWQQHAWYLVGVGLIGILHNVFVAGMKMRPEAWGIKLEYQRTFVRRSVMQVLIDAEEAYPGVGASLRDEFFPGGLRARERLIWAYTYRRRKAYEKDLKKSIFNAWAMPPLNRPGGLMDDNDIPDDGPFRI